MNHQSGSAQVVLHSLMTQEGCPGGKDEAPTLLEQKISTFFLRVVKQMPFTGSFYKTASFKYIHICNWSVDRVVNTVLHIDFKSPKERWIDWSHFRDGEKVCKHWLVIQWLRIAIYNTFVSIFGGARAMLWDTVRSGHWKYLLLNQGYWFDFTEKKGICGSIYL